MLTCDAALQAVAERVVYDQDPAIAAMGDVQYLPDYNWCVVKILQHHCCYHISHVALDFCCVAVAFFPHQHAASSSQVPEADILAAVLRGQVLGGKQQDVVLLDRALHVPGFNWHQCAHRAVM